MPLAHFILCFIETISSSSLTDQSQTDCASGRCLNHWALGREEGNVYLMTHSAHFIYRYMVSVMIKDNLVREVIYCYHYMGSFQLELDIFYIYYPTNRIHNLVFVTPAVEHWLEYH